MRGEFGTQSGWWRRGLRVGVSKASEHMQPEQRLCIGVDLDAAGQNIQLQRVLAIAVQFAGESDKFALLERTDHVFGTRHRPCANTARGAVCRRRGRG
jgi:hypothetical protein